MNRSIILFLALVLTGIFFKFAPDRRYALPVIVLDVCVFIVWLDGVVRNHSLTGRR